MIYLNEVRINHLAELTVRCNTILGLIQGGIDWMHWAIADNAMTACRAQSENELLTIVKLELDADLMIQMNSLKLSLHKILSMSDADLNLLARVTGTTLDNTTSLSPLLARNNLLSYADLDEAIQFARAQESVLFKVVSFAELVTLTTLVKNLQGMEEQAKHQASDFAQTHASTISGFADLFNFFTTALNDNPSSDSNLNLDSSLVISRYTALRPIVYQFLFTPNVGERQSEAIVRQNLPQVIASSRFIGYQTMTSAILNLSRNISFNKLDSDSLKTQAETYLTAIKKQLSMMTAGEGTYSQDGGLITYTYDSDTAHILIGVDVNGNVFIQPETILKTK